MPTFPYPFTIVKHLYLAVTHLQRVQVAHFLETTLQSHPTVLVENANRSMRKQ